MSRSRRRKEFAHPNPMVGVGYLRVSTQEQANSGLSLDAQLVAIRNYCTMHQINVLTICSDVGSGAERDRPGLKEALGYIQDHEAAMLICAKLDRVSRSSVDFGNILNEILFADGAIIIIDMGMDTRTIFGQFAAKMALLLAEVELQQLRERTQVAMDQLPRYVTHVNRLGQVKHAPGRLPSISEEAANEILRLRYDPDAPRQRTMREIADMLTLQGLAAPQCDIWYPQTISAFLRRHLKMVKAGVARMPRFTRAQDAEPELLQPEPE